MNMILYVNAAPLFKHMDCLRCVPSMGVLRVCCIHAAWGCLCCRHRGARWAVARQAAGAQQCARHARAEHVVRVISRKCGTVTAHRLTVGQYVLSMAKNVTMEACTASMFSLVRPQLQNCACLL